VQLLERALVSLGNATTVQRLNPKAMQRTALLGKLDLDTREWTDGVLTAAARQVCAALRTHTMHEVS
jgi:dynein heavy chain 2, cytosolic